MTTFAITQQICETYLVTKQWDVKYTDGCGYEQPNLYGIFWNMLLVVNKTRPSFMIQPIDYCENDRDLILNLILSNLFSHKHENKSVFELAFINQGIVVHLSKHISDEKMYMFVQENLASYRKDHNNNTLGDLLGYPCSGDIDISMSNKHRGCIVLYVNDVPIMANICDSSDMERFNQKVNNFNKMKEILCTIKETHLECCNHIFNVTYDQTEPVL